jgi:hypothetical protein
MLWAIASSVFVIYLYRKLNARSAPPSGSVPAGAIEAEITALNAHIAALENKVAGSSSGGVKP